MNWSETLIRCSCIGKIMADGRGSVLTDKQYETLLELKTKESRTPKQQETLDSLIAKRDAPPSLGDTCISYLKEVYIWEKYGKEPVGGAERSKYTMKGKLVEEDSIAMLNRIDQASHNKNDVRFKNEFLTGEPDIIVLEGETPSKIIDIKSSYDFATLLANIGSPLNSLYKYQLQGYMALTGALEAEVCYCLVNMPQEMINSEKKKLFYALNAATEDSPEYKKQVQKLENNMTFDEIPLKERVVRFPIQRDDELIQKIYTRVTACRSWLEEFDAFHTNMNQ